MRLNSVNNQQNKQNFKGLASWVAKNPKLTAGVAALAGSSVVAQKIVMSGSEAVIGPIMDVGIGDIITNATKETDGRTKESSKAQAIRTFAQSTGGTIIGVIIRLICIGAMTALCANVGKKAGSEVGKILTRNLKEADMNNAYKFQENASKWGKNLGGALATGVMLFTNFVIDVPFINFINKKATNFVENFNNNKNEQKQVKEAK